MTLEGQSAPGGLFGTAINGQWAEGLRGEWVGAGVSADRNGVVGKVGRVIRVTETDHQRSGVLNRLGKTRGGD